MSKRGETVCAVKECTSSTTGKDISLFGFPKDSQRSVLWLEACDRGDLRLVPPKMPAENIQYSEKYCDEHYEYRHVILPPDLAKLVPRPHLMTESEWRNLGVQQSPNWVHYMLHSPEPHVLLFRRPLSHTEY